MNLMGKMFIVLIFIMSIMFMGFSVVIYATHTNWKVIAEKRSQELEVKEKEKQQLQAERDEIVESTERELGRRASTISTLNTQITELQADNDKFKEELTQLNATRDQETAAVKLSHESMVASRSEVDGLRKDLRKAQEDWAKLYSTLVASTDEAHDLAMKLANYRSVGKKLATDYRDAIAVLRHFGYKPVPELYTGIPPKGVQGIVTEVRPDGGVEISIGEDAGIMKGHRLDVVRNLGGRSSLIGKIEILRTEPDKSAAIFLTEGRRGTIQRDDIVEHIDINELTTR